MKPLLALSKREPVFCAIGITADGDGVIFMDKKAKAKKCLAMLKAAAGKEKIQLQAATLRFGKAEVDTDYDSGMVRFFINKDAPGNMRGQAAGGDQEGSLPEGRDQRRSVVRGNSEDDQEGQEASTSASAPGADASCRRRRRRTRRRRRPCRQRRRLTPTR